jgi:large subunit ribosomal protein L31
MRENIHPKYFEDAIIVCACGNTWKTGSTRKEIRTDVCSRCHPFFTGEQRIVDTEGQVDRFYRKLQARKQFQDQSEARDASRLSPERTVEALDIGNRATDALVKAGLTNVGQVLDKLNEGEQTLLDLDGFGRKALADLKKRLRQLGYDIPNPEEAVA